MWRLLLCGWLALAAPALGAQEGPVDRVKEGVKEAGKAVGETAVKFGHAVRDGAKKAGRTVGHGARKVGQGFKQGGKAVGKGVKEAVHQD